MSKFSYRGAMIIDDIDLDSSKKKGGDTIKALEVSSLIKVCPLTSPILIHHTNTVRNLEISVDFMHQLRYESPFQILNEIMQASFPFDNKTSFSLVR